MVDWQKDRSLLVSASDAAIRKFLSKRRVSELSAIGFVFELWNASPQFDLCANTHVYLEASRVAARARSSESADDDELRWNSGEFEFPAGLDCEDDHSRNAWSAWNAEFARLHQLADQDEYSQHVYDGLIRISCEALAESAANGLFGDWSRIDFNVSEVGDDIQRARERDEHIRQLIGLRM